MYRLSYLTWSSQTILWIITYGLYISTYLLDTATLPRDGGDTLYLHLSSLYTTPDERIQGARPPTPELLNLGLLPIPPIRRYADFADICRYDIGDDTISATYIFTVTIPDKPSALPISYRQIVDDIGETGK
jgi:hypothetical protein